MTDDAIVENVSRQSTILEQHPKFPFDPSLPAELELVGTGDGFEYRFKDVGIRVEIDGETYVPDSIAPTDGYVKLAPDAEGDDMVRAGGLDVKLHVDMGSSIVTTGGDYDGK